MKNANCSDESSFEMTISIIDADADTRQRLEGLTRAAGYHVDAYATASEFLARCPDDKPGVVLLDLCLPDMHGLEVQQLVAGKGCQHSVIFHTSLIDVPMIVQSIKRGAEDFLVKPCNESQLLEAIKQGTDSSQEKHKEKKIAAALHQRFALLSPREREVLEHVIAGRLNKQIAYDLGTCEQTIKVHRGNLMKKLQVKTFLELLHLADQAGITPKVAT
jgi:FixJ family two-component response regulator